MHRDHIRCVVRTVISVMAQVAKKTSTSTDDFMVNVLTANQDRLVDAVVLLLPTDTCQDPTETEIRQALSQVGIKV